MPPPPPSGLPHSLLLALGLSACDGKDGDDSATTGPCLNFANSYYHTDVDTDADTDTDTDADADADVDSDTDTDADTDTPSDTHAASDTARPTETGRPAETADTALGPCLDTGPRRGETADTSGGICLTGHIRDTAPTTPAAATDRTAVERRILGDGLLPADVAARLDALTRGE